jgi:nitrite reductase (NO-forming)
VRIAFGVVWAIDAMFKYRPGFHKEFLAMVDGAGQGQPGWLHWWFRFWSNTVTPHPHIWAYSIAGIETLIAVALILGFARKITYIVAMFTGLGIWAVAEGFGGPYTATSTDIGAAVMYVFVAAALLVLSLQCGRSRYSVDYHIEKRIPWWHWVAEFGWHNHPAPSERPGGLSAPAARSVVTLATADGRPTATAIPAASTYGEPPGPNPPSAPPAASL